MIRKSKKLYSDSVIFVSGNFSKLIVIGIVFLGLRYLLTLPYINLFAAIFSYIPHLVALILFIIFFRPQKRTILLIGLGLLAISYPFLLLNIHSIAEVLGIISYLLIGSYIILQIKDTYFT
jgi:hypothetical protein